MNITMKKQTHWIPQIHLLLLVVLCSSGIADAAVITVNATFEGQNVSIGKIDVSVGIQGTTGKEEATFTFDDPWGKLDARCDFRWFQIITSDDCPVTCGGGKNPVFPFVDPPSGGWDYPKTNHPIARGLSPVSRYV